MRSSAFSSSDPAYAHFLSGDDCEPLHAREPTQRTGQVCLSQAGPTQARIAQIGTVADHDASEDALIPNTIRAHSFQRWEANP